MRIKIILFIFTAMALGLIPARALAYGQPTHAYLTAEIFDFYNKHFPERKLPIEWKPYLMNGSRHEDEELRWMNHFYDPVYNRGLTYDPAIDPAFAIIQLMTWKSSREWANDSAAQEALRYKIVPALASLADTRDKAEARTEELAGITLSALEKDFTWQRAIRHYVLGDKEKAMFILGHILHLIEDASVPDHTRNDPHPDSPYENWTLKFTSGSPDSSLKQRLASKSPIFFADLERYFDSMAIFSNNNFYSKDTIGEQSGYFEPQLDYAKQDGKYFYAFKNIEGREYRLFIYKQYFGSLIIASKKDIALNIENEERVLKDYWSFLSTKAVQHGAGVINLFFEEAERAANDPDFDVTEPKTQLVQAIQSTASALMKVGDGIANLSNRLV